ncbi:MAG: biosis protein MshQ, partial [Campylobacterota bacterium]|nr:biosis protein MshQ [Campylobacterota bacterium]
MKNFKKLIRPLLIGFMFVFSSVNAYAVEIVNETFVSNITGWTVSNTSNVYWTSTNSNSMFIDSGDWAHRTYSFGASYANQTLDI